MSSGREEGSMNDRLYFKSALIRDDAEFLCLTDMWKAAEADDGKRPSRWLELDATSDFAAFIRDNVGQGDIIRGERGRNGATWAHWQLAMAYAKHLSPEFHAWCNDVVRAVMTGRQPTVERGHFDPVAIGNAVAAALSPALSAIADGLRMLTVTVVDRLDAMQKQLDDMKSGGLGAIVTKAQSDFLLSECRAIAATYYTGKQAKSVKAALCSVHNRLRKELEWFGTGRTFRMLPATRYADAMVELSALRREANAAAQAVSNARQMTIMDVIERGQAEEARAKASAKGNDEPSDPSDKH